MHPYVISNGRGEGLLCTSILVRMQLSMCESCLQAAAEGPRATDAFAAVAAACVAGVGALANTQEVHELPLTYDDRPCHPQLMTMGLHRIRSVFIDVKPCDLLSAPYLAAHIQKSRLQRILAFGENLLPGGIGM